MAKQITPVETRDEVIAFITQTADALDERRKIKYWVAPESIREGSPLREKSQHMVDADDLFYAVALLRTYKNEICAAIEAHEVTP